MKKCTKCGLEKELDRFGLVRGKLRAQCKECDREYARQYWRVNPDRAVQYRAANRDACRAASRKAYHANREHYLEVKRKHHKEHREEMRATERKRLYGLSESDFQSLLVAHKGKCAICGNPAPIGGVLRVDHDHQSGRVRGLLCNRCNLLLGLAKDDPERLLEAALYLESRGG